MGSLPLFSDMPPLHSVHELARDYHQSHLDPAAVESNADHLLAQGGPLAPHTVIIPVAAHQEAHTIYPAMAQYAKQVTDQPFSVVAYLNAPSTADERPIAASYDAFERARRDFPHLDLRSLSARYLQPTIGAIRKDAWDAVLAAGLKGHTITPTQDLTAINHDIDLVNLPRTYISRLQRHDQRSIYRRQHASQQLGRQILLQGTPFIGPVKHAADPAFPNVSRATFLFDWSIHAKHASYEAGLVVPMSHYAAAGGINPSDTTSEVFNMMSDTVRLIKAPALETSGRRFVEKLHTHPLDNVWGEASFHDTEDYRDTPAALRDISRDRLHHLTGDYIAQSLAATAFSTATHATVRSVNLTPGSALHTAYSNWLDNTFSSHDFAVIEQSYAEISQPLLRTARYIMQRVVQHPDTDQLLAEADDQLSAEMNLVFSCSPLQKVATAEVWS